MEAVMIPSRTVVHINGIPVALAADTIIKTTYENMRYLTGHHYAHVEDTATPLSTLEIVREAVLTIKD